MPSTPLAGQISFTQIKELTTDKLGYIPPANVSIGTLADVVRQFGQKGPLATNLAFSNFYQSTIAGYVIETTSETQEDYYQLLDDGAIKVIFRSTTFKKYNTTQYYVKVTVQENDGEGDNQITSVVKLITWNSSTTDNFINVPNLDSGPYTVTVTDLTTGALINSTEVEVGYVAGKKTYFYNG